MYICLCIFVYEKTELKMFSSIDNLHSDLTYLTDLTDKIRADTQYLYKCKPTYETHFTYP